MKLTLANYQAAIFDMDGTMVDNMAYHRQAWRIFCRRHGVHLSATEFQQKLSGKKNSDYFATLFGNRFSEIEQVLLVEEKEAIYRDLYQPHIQPVEGLIPFLDKLQAKQLPCAVATTAPAKNREMVFTAVPLRSYFSVVVGDEDVTYGKPNPEIYLLAAQKLQLNPHHCLAFEDSPSGVAAAKAAGCYTVGLLTTFTANQLHQADTCCHDYRKIELS